MIAAERAELIATGDRTVDDRRVRIRILIALVLFALPTLLLRGDLWHIFAVVNSVMMAGFALVCALAIHAFGLGYKHGADERAWNSTAKSMALFSIFPAIVVLSIVPGLALQRLDTRRAQAFAEMLVPRLEAFRVDHGHYPQELKDVITPEDRLPAYFDESLLRPWESASISVHGEGADESFEILLFDSMFSNWAFNSTTAQWTYQSC